MNGRYLFAQPTLLVAALIAALMVAGNGAACLAQGKAPGGGGGTPGAGGQLGRAKSAPNDYYFQTMGTYYDGDFRSALRNFRDAARMGIASTEGRWIDSICYYTMLGECYYQMGEYGNALDQYNAALELYLAHRDWMLRVEFPPGLDPAGQVRNTITWGTTSRTAVVGAFADRYQSLQGRLDNDKVIEKGGVVAPPQFYPVYVSEIIRCTATALRRRREIMGPTCEHNLLTVQLVDALSRRPGPPNHWSQCWVELELGLAYAGAGKHSQAIAELQKSLLAAGTYDHPLTGMALLELGKLAFEEEKYDIASTFFIEATFTASLFNQIDVMEEAFHEGFVTHQVAGRQGAYSPLVAAAAWAKNKKMRRLSVSLLTDLAENLAEMGDLNAATQALGQAKTNTGRSDLMLGIAGSRINYQSARLAMDAGNLSAGAAALNAALGFQTKSSKRLFQISVVDRMFTSNSVTERIADNLYANVLREPTARDWVVDPLDTMAVVTTPLPMPYERWFELALVRKEQEKALEITDRIRRRRFYASMPLGGRVLALRWLLEAPADSLDEAGRLQRQDLLVRFPKFAETSQQVKAVQTELDALPAIPTDDADIKKQEALLQQLGKLSAEQELMLQQIALRRIPSEFVFPPLRNFLDIQKKLPEDRLVLVYFQTTRNVHAFAFTTKQYAYFTVESPNKVRADVVDMLRKMGHLDRNQPVDAADLKSDAWKVPATKLVKQLTNNAKVEEWAAYKEIIIVPDGVLWYLPFESLQVPGKDGTESLISRMSVRYVPTMSLVLPDTRTRKSSMRTALVTGKLLPRDDAEVADEAAGQLAEVITDSFVAPDKLPSASALFSSRFDRLVLLTDIDEPEKGPFAWSPMQLDRGKPGSTLADWMLLPWASPEQLIIPGFHTAAESGLKKGGNGEEVFLAVCGMMANGSRTMLLSRWRVGGQSTINLLREFIQELPHESADQAWRRSITINRESLLDPAAEGRVKTNATLDGMKTDHPFFWAGYMLIDTGSQPLAEEKAAAK
jgi:CHAT domain-containing protein